MLPADISCDRKDERHLQGRTRQGRPLCPWSQLIDTAAAAEYLHMAPDRWATWRPARAAGNEETSVHARACAFKWHQVLVAQE